ncbi:hypothetical protein B0H16DRAFT_1466812 [Mycena metata]|uniref:Uncharacterized protein n=1 Tax=Mycena metata TaxID=1033252 RepID=A0AAD7MX97_9AGAR|nr:hypothetical protein B0H16DRAFT_1466812 [Mycena metata]
MSHLTDAPLSPSPSPQTRGPMSFLYHGGALDSQLSHTQYLATLSDTTPSMDEDSNAAGDKSFNSGSSDTTYEKDDEYYCSFLSHTSAPGLSAHSQGDEFVKTGPVSAADDPMDAVPGPFPPSRPSTPEIMARYSNLKPEDIRLSTTEAGIIGAMRADREVEMMQYASIEGQLYTAMSKTHNQRAHIAALETRVASLASLLEYHRIPVPA